MHLINSTDTKTFNLNCVPCAYCAKTSCRINKNAPATHSDLVESDGVERYVSVWWWWWGFFGSNFFGHTFGMWKLLGQEWNLCHTSNTKVPNC